MNLYRVVYVEPGKVVPANVRAFVDMKVESQKPKRKGKDASASAVGD